MTQSQPMFGFKGATTDTPNASQAAGFAATASKIAQQEPEKPFDFLGLAQVIDKGIIQPWSEQKNLEDMKVAKLDALKFLTEIDHLTGADKVNAIEERIKTEGDNKNFSDGWRQGSLTYLERGYAQALGQAEDERVDAVVNTIGGAYRSWSETNTWATPKEFVEYASSVYKVPKKRIRDAVLQEEFSTNSVLYGSANSYKEFKEIDKTVKERMSQYQTPEFLLNNSKDFKPIINSLRTGINKVKSDKIKEFVEQNRAIFKSAIANPENVMDTSVLSDAYKDLVELGEPEAAAMLRGEWEDAVGSKNYMNTVFANYTSTDIIPSTVATTDGFKKKEWENKVVSDITLALSSNDIDKVNSIVRAQGEYIGSMQKEISSRISTANEQEFGQYVRMFNGMKTDTKYSLLKQEDVNKLIGYPLAMKLLNTDLDTVKQKWAEAVNNPVLRQGDTNAEYIKVKEHFFKKASTQQQRNTFEKLSNVLYSLNSNPEVFGDLAEKLLEGNVEFKGMKMDTVFSPLTENETKLYGTALKSIADGLGEDVEDYTAKALPDGTFIIVENNIFGDIPRTKRYTTSELNKLGQDKYIADNRPTPNEKRLDYALESLHKDLVEFTKGAVDVGKDIAGVVLGVPEPVQKSLEGLNYRYQQIGISMREGLKNLGSWAQETVLDLITDDKTGKFNTVLGIAEEVAAKTGKAIGGILLPEAQGAELDNYDLKTKMYKAYDKKNSNLPNPLDSTTLDALVNDDHRQVKDYTAIINKLIEERGGERYLLDIEPIPKPTERVENMKDIPIDSFTQTLSADTQAILGDPSSTDIEKIQTLAGVRVDGIVGNITKQAIQSLPKGSEEVKAIQNMIGAEPDGDWGTNSKVALDMFLNEDIKNSNRPEGSRIFASGHYQVIPETMMSLVANNVVSPNDKYNNKTQEKIADYILTTRRPAISDFVFNNGDIEKAMFQLAYEWASFPVPKDVTKNGKKINKGSSFYGSGNKAHVSVQEVREALTQAMKNKDLTPIKTLIKQAESASSGGINAYNQGTKKGKGIVKGNTEYDLSSMTIGEILKASLNKQD